MSQEREAKEKNRADDFVRCLQLAEISLDDLNLDVNRSFVKKTGKLDIGLNVNTSFVGEKGERDFEASCLCSISGKTSESEKIFDLSIRYIVRYRVVREADWSDGEIKFFSDRNVIIHVWPYLRELTDQISGRANLNRVILPMLPPGVVPNKNDK